jgi:hypothetical protein
MDSKKKRTYSRHFIIQEQFDLCQSKSCKTAAEMRKNLVVICKPEINLFNQWQIKKQDKDN